MAIVTVIQHSASLRGMAGDDLFKGVSMSLLHFFPIFFEEGLLILFGNISEADHVNSPAN